MPRMLASRISLALPRMLPEAIFLMKAGMSICVGQARVHGASKQNKQRLASTLALCGANGGLMSAKFFSYSASDNFGARFLIMLVSVWRDPSRLSMNYRARPGGRNAKLAGHRDFVHSCVMAVAETVDGIYRTEARRILATLIPLLRDFDL